MVYNAMKLFMEINPQLFDDCSHEYTEQQNSAAAREAQREQKWASIADQANKMRSLNGDADASRAHNPSLAKVDEVDGTEDSQKRLDSLNLQDARSAGHDRQNSSSSSHSQR